MPKRESRAKKQEKKSLKPKSNQRVHPGHHAGVAKIQALARDLKIPFRIIKSHKHAVDPQVVYFLPAEADPSFNKKDLSSYSGGYLFYKFAFHAVLWNPGCRCCKVVSIAAVRKWLQDPHLVNAECIICFDKVRADDYSSCHQCHCILCTFCHVQDMLSEEALEGIESQRAARCGPDCYCHLQSIPVKCVQCRKQLHSGLYDTYYKVLDRLDEFKPAQKRVLQELCDLDEHFPAVRDWFVQLHTLKAGVLVVLQNLVKEEWNGKVAVITGKCTEIEGVRRWPIKLKVKSGAAAIYNVKEANVKMFNCPALRMNSLSNQK